MTRETVALKEYFCMKLAKIEANLNDKIDNLKEATMLAKDAVDTRLAGMNEFRSALKDQSSTFITRSEYALSHEKIQLEIDLLKEFKAELKGKASQSQYHLSLIFNITSLIVAAVALFWKIIG